MVQTVISGVSAYCTVSQFLDRRDWRTVGRLLSDTDTVPANRAAVEADAKLGALLKGASGRIERACFRGGRYTAADLEALAETNAGEDLADLIADLTMYRVYGRRPDKRAEISEDYKLALEVLKQ